MSKYKPRFRAEVYLKFLNSHGINIIIHAELMKIVQIKDQDNTWLAEYDCHCVQEGLDQAIADLKFED
jgi:hypothetical protein